MDHILVTFYEGMLQTANSGGDEEHWRKENGRMGLFKKMAEWEMTLEGQRRRLPCKDTGGEEITPEESSALSI